MRQRSAGFSLLEVVVALAVLALSLGVLFRLFGQSLSNLGRSEQYTRAVAVAEGQLAALGADPALGLRSYRKTVDDRFEVIVSVTPWEEDRQLAALPVRPYRVSVKVEWSGERAGAVAVDTIRLGRTR